MRHDLTLLTEHDLYLFNEGNHFHLQDKLGAHLETREGIPGTFFAVWAPNAAQVSVVGNFNDWRPGAWPLVHRGTSGIWEGFAPGIGLGAVYKYHIVSRYHGYKVEKADPVGFLHECPPRTASVVWDLAYDWGDAEWMASRKARHTLHSPMSLYEVHLGSWRRKPQEGNRSLTYRELAVELADYVCDAGFTHVELMPVMEHPFFGSWGYQITGFFAPTRRQGSPQDLMYLIDVLHRRGIGVILDWVPSHFPSDEHGLAYFDGTCLFEHADVRQGFHPDWKSLIFNYGRNEVRSFLVSSAFHWLEKYHADGLRVDAVASMLYLDYSRKEGEWVPNEYGGRENLPAITFLRRLNEAVYEHFPDVQMSAEESTAWPMVSRPVYVGGLGFGMKWDMGWMHDMLRYMGHDPVHRRFHHNELTFRMLYAFTENFVLPLSHDEVVHGKGSLIGRMPGDEWQRFANLRLLFGNQWTQPGKKILFMGGEFGQWREWHHETSLDWRLMEQPLHRGLQRWVADLNRLYRAEPSLHARDQDGVGFQWIDCSDSDNGVVAYLRRAGPKDPGMLVAFNFTPIPRVDYRLGVPTGGVWREMLNSDAAEYGGSGLGNLGGVEAVATPCHGRDWSVSLLLPPLGVVILKP